MTAGEIDRASFKTLRGAKPPVVFHNLPGDFCGIADIHLLQNGLQQARHFRRVFCDLDAAGFHDFQLRLSGIGTA
jgi:hypothetical protein